MNPDRYTEGGGEEGEEGEDRAAGELSKYNLTI